MSETAPVRDAKACPFCGDLITQATVLPVLGKRDRVGVIHPTAQAGDQICALDSQTIALTAWNARR